MKRVAGLLACCISLLIGCGQVDDDSRLNRVRDGRLPADNVIVYDNGVRQTLGLRALGRSGNFDSSGPTVVYVFRSITPGDAEVLKRDGIAVNEHTAYLLPPGGNATKEAMLRMERIGTVEPSLTIDEIASRFRLGQTASAPVAVAADDSDQSNATAEREHAASADAATADEADESPSVPGPTAPPAQTRATSDREAKIDAEAERISLEMNRMLARLAADHAAGRDTSESTLELEELRLQLAAVMALQREQSPPTGVSPPPESTAPADDSGALPLDPRHADCAEVNRRGESGMAIAATRDAIAEFATGFAGAFLDYGVCDADEFDADLYMDQLPEYCADNPDDSIQDSVAAFVCPDGLAAR